MVLLDTWALFHQLGADIPGFFVWAIAIAAILGLGYIPGFRTPSRWLLALVVLVIVLTQYRQVISGFTTFASTGAAATSAGTPTADPASTFASSPKAPLPSPAQVEGVSGAGPAGAGAGAGGGDPMSMVTGMLGGLAGGIMGGGGGFLGGMGGGDIMNMAGGMGGGMMGGMNPMDMMGGMNPMDMLGGGGFGGGGGMDMSSMSSLAMLALL